MQKKLRIGFIGLGLMGNPMAKNILSAGFTLNVYNRTLSKTNELQKLGATVYENPAELAQNSDVIISMITGGADVKSIYFGKKGIIEGATRGLILIDMGTIGVSAAKNIDTKLNKLGMHFIDAPVTGSVPKAITGELTIFVGGDEKIYKKIKPVLQSMGTAIHYMGASGSGQAIKLINNMLVAITIGATAEAMIFADAIGLPRQKVVEALSGVPAVSGFMQMKMRNMANNTYPLAFSFANMYKDVKLANTELGKKSKKILPFLSQIEKIYADGMKKELAETDMSTLIKLLE